MPSGPVASGGSGGIRTHSAEAPALQAGVTLPRYRAPELCLPAAFATRQVEVAGGDRTRRATVAW